MRYTLGIVLTLMIFTTTFPINHSRRSNRRRIQEKPYQLIFDQEAKEELMFSFRLIVAGMLLLTLTKLRISHHSSIWHHEEQPTDPNKLYS